MTLVLRRKCHFRGCVFAACLRYVYGGRRCMCAWSHQANRSGCCCCCRLHCCLCSAGRNFRNHPKLCDVEQGITLWFISSSQASCTTCGNGPLSPLLLRAFSTLWATQHIYGVSINSLIKTEAMKSLKLHAPKPQLFRCIAACSAAAAAGDVSNLMSAFASSGNFYSGD
jgi:hypothetical protein